MKLNIVMRCSTCNRLLDYTHEIDQDGVAIFVKSPCPVCYPARVTPKEGEWIEVKAAYFPDRAFNTRKYLGQTDLDIITTEAVAHDDLAVWDQWRYPGETEWRD